MTDCVYVSVLCIHYIVGTKCLGNVVKNVFFFTFWGYLFHKEKLNVIKICECNQKIAKNLVLCLVSYG